MNTVDPVLMNQLRVDCCLVSSVTCLNNRVTGILWDGKDLDGTINGTAFPSTLDSIDVSSNLIVGSLPSMNAGMLNFLAGDNQMTGTIPTNLPNGLIYLEIDTNNFYGDLPNFPLTLTGLHLGIQGNYPQNHFTGTLRLNKPDDIYIFGNWITDVIIQDSSILGTNCDLSNNPLLGNPSISSLQCRKVGLYSASLLPYTISSSLKLTAKATLQTIATSTTSTKTTTMQSTLQSTTIQTTNETTSTKVKTSQSTTSHLSQITSQTKNDIKTSLQSSSGISAAIPTQYLSPFKKTSMVSTALLFTSTLLHSTSTSVQQYLTNHTEQTLTTNHNTDQVYSAFRPIQNVINTMQVVVQIIKILVNILVMGWVFKNTPWTRKTRKSQIGNDLR